MTTPRARTDWQKALEMRTVDHSQRIQQLEQNQAVYIALSDERRKTMEERFTRVDQSIAQTKEALAQDVRGLKNVLNRLNWLIVIAVLGALISSVIVDPTDLIK